MGRVVSFEMSSQHPEEAARFYEAVFGWRVDSPRWDYWPVATGEAPASGIDGGISRGPSDYPHGTRVMIEVEDIDASLATAVENGARVVREKMTFEDFHLAYLVDPVGIVFGLTQAR